jgi:AcrR family transcriptional regulator
MSPKTRDPDARRSIIDATARVLADQGSAALTARAVARELGTSTMAVYTYFGSMGDLRRAVRREGFTTLAKQLDAVPISRDPLVHVAALGAAYVANALANPQLYKAMFQEAASTEEDSAAAYATFEQLLGDVERCVRMDRFSGRDPTTIATQLWAIAHGVVSLQLSGLLTADAAVECLRQLAFDLFTSLGSSSESARTAIDKAVRML